LSYAHKDADDIASLLSGAAVDDIDIHVHTYTNAEVTVDAIDAAQAILAATEPRDTVILFVAGHGMYDDEAEPTYYYLTHDAELDDLENTAANFERIESLLDGIPARNKLFLLDTCQSGESTQATDPAAGDASGAHGLSARAIPRSSLLSSGVKKAEPRPWLHERDRFIHRDLRRRTGAIVFSSSLGSEYSWESRELENGAFTRATIEALSSDGRRGSGPRADDDDNGRVSIRELKTYVRERVPQLTEHKQHPTVDRDNVRRQFELPEGHFSAW